jgi:hypothetical protein
MDSDFNANAYSARIVSGVLCAGLYKNVLRVVRPTQKYTKTAQGTMQAEGEGGRGAREGGGGERRSHH